MGFFLNPSYDASKSPDSSCRSVSFLLPAVVSDQQLLAGVPKEAGKQPSF